MEGGGGIIWLQKTTRNLLEFGQIILYYIVLACVQSIYQSFVKKRAIHRIKTPKKIYTPVIFATILWKPLIFNLDPLFSQNSKVEISIVYDIRLQRYRDYFLRTNFSRCKTNGYLAIKYSVIKRKQEISLKWQQFSC